MNAETIGSALQAKRRDLGLEKGQAADKIGMSRTTYSSYEQDTQRPSADVFPALAQFLGATMEDFLVLYGATCVAAVRPALARILDAERIEEVHVDGGAQGEPERDVAQDSTEATRGLGQPHGEPEDANAIDVSEGISAYEADLFAAPDDSEFSALLDPEVLPFEIEDPGTEEAVVPVNQSEPHHVAVSKYQVDDVGEPEAILVDRSIVFTTIEGAEAKRNLKSDDHHSEQKKKKKKKKGKGGKH